MINNPILIKKLSYLSYALLLIWLVYNYAFMLGYQDAVNDNKKNMRSYDFSNSARAFR
jgi:hypothetical protein